jgi:LysM repeat protein
MALLMQGCKKDADTGTTGSPESTNTATPAFVEPTNTPAAPTNLVTAPTTNIPMTPVIEPQPPAANPSDYVIVKGDTFSTIAKKFHVSVKALLDANPSVEPTKLKIGQTIHVPPAPVLAAVASSNGTAAGASDTNSSGQTYSVKSGDSLTKIAGQFGVTIKALRSANNLKTDKIVVGQKLAIPGKAPAQPSGTAPGSTTAPTGQ